MKFVPKPLERTADNSRGDHSWRTFAKNAAIVVGVLLFVYILLGFSADQLAHRIPESWESRLFLFDDWENAATNDEQQERALAVFERLVTSPSLRPLEYHLVILEDPDPNAFAFPGGTIGLTTGLLEMVESETGLALVISHEFGHHQNRDALKRIGRALVHRGLFAWLFGGGGEALVDTTMDLAEAAHTRDQERAADRFALDLVLENYEDDGSILEFFEKLDMEENEQGAHWASFLTSHPLTVERLEDLRMRLMPRRSENP